MKIEEITTAEWIGFVSDHPHATLFHTKEWLKLLEEGFPRISIRLYSLTDEQGQLIGVVPVEFMRRWFLRLAGSPLPGLFTPYQGPLFSKDCSTSGSVVPEFLSGKLSSHFLAIALPPGSPLTVSCLSSANWKVFRTLLLNLEVGIDQLWKNLKVETRNQIRQAERRRVEIYEARSLDEWLEDYLEMHKAVYLRQRRRPPGSLAFYKALWTHLYNKGWLKVILAKHEGKIIAGGVFAIYKDTMYFLDGASFREYGKLRANNLIQWHVICWAASQGLRIYDMVGANIPSIAHFKRGFGGTEVVYPYFQAAYGLLGKIGFRAYEQFRPLLKRLGV
ncbi:MAG: GNAT family N-acetyltransferase [Desulfitobacteriaceae bacterium]|nr:GNAT family N-acetyltransferase [Desulfitobacteriaceae bacterium]